MTNHHGDDYQGTLKANFSSNVWYGADNTGLYHHLSGILMNTGRYPEIEAESLRAVLAGIHGLNASQISAGNGSIEIIYRIAQAYRGKKSIILSPAFSEYSKACSVNDHEIILCSRENLLVEIEKSRPDLVWICNPNNPDGYCFERKELQTVFYTHPEVKFIVDQSFIDFTLQETLPAAAILEFQNILLIYSLTKRYAIPGLRIGYVIASEAIIKQLDRYKIPWSVNMLALEAGKYLLTRHDNSFHLESWLAETVRFQQEIDKTGIFETLPSQTPFFLVKLLKGTAAELKEYLLTEGILIRDATDFNYFGTEMIRLNTLSADKNNLLIDKFKAWKQHISL